MANISSIGRFSSQMLTYLGTQRTVVGSSNSPVNAYKYATGPVIFPSPTNIADAFLDQGVVGDYSSNTCDSTKCYFLSRGASQVYADTMTALAIDIASLLNISPQQFLESSEQYNKLNLSDSIYSQFNILRDPAHQVGTVTSVDNKFSIQARQIRV